ncbi:DUF4838 domain-containing protein [Chryseobacterium taklimakanense]|uniref:DUF4838 domain-containing protein n=1 Tax=Chryseobacterium taklimakanense TaxID=536441 RepID=UPI0013DDD858|nr:DUF4838 domain-containing protein [Chryseobacterium taklimakanense]
MKLLLSFCFVLISFFGKTQSIEIANNGFSKTQIVIPKNATSDEKEAADVLRSYISRISGVALPVVYDTEKSLTSEILVGLTSRTDKNILSGVDPDGVVIKNSGSKLIISGGSDKGVLNAAYEFIEKYLGCRKFTNDFVEIPKQTVIKISALNVKYNPPFTFRSVYSLDAIWHKEYRDWHKLNSEFEGRGSQVHTFKELLPAEKYFKIHPEYFALVNGKRTATQPCLSRPEVFTIMKENLAAAIIKNPQFKIWSVSHNDNGDYCHCELCEPKHNKGNGFSETLIPFVNKIASAFSRYTISTLAYNQSMLPPVLSAPANNVEIMFCLTYTDKIVPLATAKDDTAIIIKRSLNGWKNLTSNIFLWDYPVNYNYSLAPFPNLQTLQPNIQYFRQHNIKKVFEQLIGTQKGEMSELKSYLLAKLLWNPDIDLAATQDEFLKGYYGKGWQDIKSYLRLLETEAKKSGMVMNEYVNPTLFLNTIYSDSNMQKYRALFNSAMQKEPGTILQKESLSLDYIDLLKLKTKAGTAKSGNYKNLQQKADVFVQKANKLGVVKLENDGKSPEDFRNELLK